MNRAFPAAAARDGRLLDLSDPRAVALWSHKLGITPDQLRRAVKQVGSDVTVLAKYVGKPAGGPGDPSQH